MLKLPSRRWRKATAGAHTAHAVTGGAAVVRATVPRTQRWGREKPSVRNSRDDHAPAVQTTVEVRISPCSVTTPLTESPLMDTTCAAQPRWITAPWVVAARAN